MMPCREGRKGFYKMQSMSISLSQNGARLGGKKRGERFSTAPNKDDTEGGPQEKRGGEKKKREKTLVFLYFVSC